MKSISTNNTKYNIKRRINFVSCFFLLLLITIVFRAGYLQIWCASSLSEKAEKQYEKSLAFYGKRGVIYDRNLKKLADTLAITSIGAHPRQINDKKAAAQRLAGVLSENQSVIYRKLSSPKPFVWIERKVSPAVSRSVRALKLNGIVFKTEHSRFYPNKTLAAQLIGFAGVDGTGLEGVEFAYNNVLQGGNGKLTFLKDGRGQRFESLNHDKQIQNGYKKELKNGNDLILTIDRNIQYITEKVLAETVKKHQAKSGMAIVMTPQTGEVLALTHYPAFNPHAFNRYDKTQWRNRIVTDPFEPGSTMKIFSAAAAIESGQCSANTSFYCEKGSYRIGGNTIHDAGSHSFGWLTLHQIIKYSSNIGVVKVVEKIGKDVLYKTLTQFGFGQKTGIDCPAETSGTLSPASKWKTIDTAAIAFGHGIAVSAIQLVTATAAIANHGIMMKPYVVKAITYNHGQGASGQLIQSFPPTIVRRVISETTARSVTEMMVSVVRKGGTGVNASTDGYFVCGKTGTAQKIDPDGKYSKKRFIASFLGFAPAYNPRIALLISIDEPTKEGYYGGTVAAPAFRKITSETLDYLNVEPDTNGAIDSGLTASFNRGTQE